MWKPVSGGLCSNDEFLADMDRQNDLILSWYKLPIFGVLGLNNRGRTADRDKRTRKRILSVAATHSYPVPSCDSRVRLQREAAAEKAVRQQMRAENANPRVRSGVAPGGSLAPPSPALQSSAASSASFCIHPLGAVHPGATAPHAAPREFGENTQPLRPPSGPPQIGLLSQRHGVLRWKFLKRRTAAEATPIMIAWNISRDLLCAGAHLHAAPRSSLGQPRTHRALDPRPARGPRRSSRLGVPRFRRPQDHRLSR